MKSKITTRFNQDVILLNHYFVFDVGKVTHPFNLEFEENPTKQENYNHAIFNFLSKFKEKEQIFECLNYHYRIYKDKQQFIDFFKEETPKILEKGKKNDEGRFAFTSNWLFPSYIPMYEACLEWVNTKKYKQVDDEIGIVQLQRNDINEYKILQVLHGILKMRDNSNKPLFDASDLTVAKFAKHFSPLKDNEIITLANDKIPTIRSEDRQIKNGVELIDYEKEFLPLLEPLRQYLLNDSNVQVRVKKKKD